MFIKTISESKYQTFKECKLKYRYRYVDRLPEPGAANTEALHFGSYIHQVLEEGVEAKDLAELEELSKGIKGSYKVSKKYDGKDLICFRNFLKFNAKLGKTEGIELVFEVPLEGDITLNGVIDRIIKGSDGGYLVIDYKTSKREKSRVELYQDSQLKGYAYAVHKLYNVPLSKITAAHYYPLTNNFVHVKYSIPQINAHVKTVVKKVWDIRKAKKEDMRPSRNQFCDWCVWQKKHCPEFSDGYSVQKAVEESKQEKKRLNEEKKK